MATAAPTEGIGLRTAELKEIGLGVPILRGSLKRCKSLHAGLRLSDRELDRRFAHADALEALVKNANGSGAVLVPSLRESAVVCLSLLRGRMDEEKDRMIKLEEDPDALNKRITALDRIGTKLGDQLTTSEDDEGEDDESGNED